MKVLVTGGQGYIGRVLTPMLRRAGHDVVVVDSDLYERCDFGAGSHAPSLEFGSAEGSGFLRKDIRDLERRELEGFEAVIHLAALSNDPLGDLDPRLTYEINHLATVRLAELAKEAGVGRFIFSSSCSTYGAAGTAILDETANFNPVTPYGRSKVWAEQGVRALEGAGFATVVLRHGTAYGVSPRMRFDLVLNNLVAWAHTTGRILLKSDGTPWRPLVHIEDISRAFLAVLEAPLEAVRNGVFNVGRTDENHQMHDLARIVAETVPGCRVEYAAGAGPDPRCYRVNCDLLPARVPDFRPRWDVRMGARELYDSYRETDLEPAEFEGPRYQRVAHIRKLLEEGIIDAELRFHGNRSVELV